MGIDGPMSRVKLGMENQGEGAGDQRRGILVRTRRGPWVWKRRLMCCLVSEFISITTEEIVDGGAVATSVSGAVPEGAFGCGKGMIVVICHEERRYLPW